MATTPAAGIAIIRIPPMAMPGLIEEIKRTRTDLSLVGRFSGERFFIMV